MLSTVSSVFYVWDLVSSTRDSKKNEQKEYPLLNSDHNLSMV